MMDLIGDSAILLIATLGIAALLGLILIRLGGKGNVALDPDNFLAFRLIEKEAISHDTRRFTFALQSPETKLGLPIGQHISFRFSDPQNGKMVLRTYTPVTGDETFGKVSFVIKVYKAGVHPKFPDGGKMSQHLDSLRIGDTMDMRGPKGHVTYWGHGAFKVKPIGKPVSERRATSFGMIAGGTGITPMLQIIKAILRDRSDRSTISLIYANQSEEDILLREELESIAKQYPDQFRLHYTLDRPPKGWTYSSGFVTKEMIEANILGPSENGSTQVFMCGPPPMIKFACIPALKDLGFTEDHWFSF
mmetsp:Transcript_51020/g.153369  ORF Transcript_51020/g.153369 Transcript_51020/m.153369 type:complete len:305 (-) Transcript_51020:118-1032(-)